MRLAADHRPSRHSGSDGQLWETQAVQGLGFITRWRPTAHYQGGYGVMKAGSNLERVLEAGHFAVTAECGPPRGADGDKVLKKAELVRF